MGIHVDFDYTAWITRYPEFSTVPTDLANAYFSEAEIYQRNDGIGQPQNPTWQSILLNMVTAHIAQLYATDPSGQPASTIVGRITNATEGSVSVTAGDMSGPQAAAWWYQTKYGASYWNATKQYRTGRYKAGYVRPTEPWFYRGVIGPGWGGWGY